jgi:hypothetical protein
VLNSINNIKTTWNIINGKINKRPRCNDISFINKNVNKTYNSQVIANTFNTYFSTLAKHNYTEHFKNSNSVAIVNNPLNYSHDGFKKMIPTIKFKFVLPKETEDVVNSLKMKDSYGYDGISTKILKQSVPYILSKMTYLCNLISTGIFPTRLKFAEIKPLYKNGKIGNRSISLLTSFSKIFEKIIYARLIHQLTHNHILVDEQFGFRTNLSMHLASYKLINDVLTSIK